MLEIDFEFLSADVSPSLCFRCCARWLHTCSKRYPNFGFNLPQCVNYVLNVINCFHFPLPFSSGACLEMLMSNVWLGLRYLFTRISNRHYIMNWMQSLISFYLFFHISSTKNSLSVRFFFWKKKIFIAKRSTSNQKYLFFLLSFLSRALCEQTKRKEMPFQRYIFHARWRF